MKDAAPYTIGSVLSYNYRNNLENKPILKNRPTPLKLLQKCFLFLQRTPTYLCCSTQGYVKQEALRTVLYKKND